MATETATLGGGCFWCIEGVFNRMEGVQSAISGYMGGQRPNPTYEQVCTGVSGHVEVVQVTFDTSITSLPEIFNVFFSIHDPTSRDRQGNDAGSQYRSVIFYDSDQQKQMAEEVIKELQPKLARPIVTDVLPAQVFYQAEAYHQDYFTKNPSQGYCMFAVAPKIEKFQKQFADKVRAS